MKMNKLRHCAMKGNDVIEITVNMVRFDGFVKSLESL